MNILTWLKEKLGMRPAFDGWDVLRHCERYSHPSRPDEVWYSVKPSVIYPATVERILQAVEGDAPPPELVEAGPIPDGVARTLLAQARAIDPIAFTWANIPADEFEDYPQEREGRRAALETARLWFTQAIHSRVGGPVGVKITADTPEDKAYRL